MIYVSNGYETKMQYGKKIDIQEMHWISGDPFSDHSLDDILGSDARESENSIRISFKTRHTPEFTDGRIERRKDGNFMIISENDIQGIAPGQYAIIYTFDRKVCLGSGMIVAPHNHGRRHNVNKTKQESQC